MKNLLLFVLCLSCWTPTLAQSEINLTPEQEEEAWELLIGLLSQEGMKELTHPERFYDDIGYYLLNPTKNDSLALQNLIDQIDPLIPQKAYYAHTIEEANFTIDIKTPQDSTTFSIHHNPKFGNRDGYYAKKLISQNSVLEIPEKYRLAAINNEVIYGLIFRPDSKGIPENNLLLKSKLLNPHINYKVQDITEIDKFLITKLYSNDLKEQVESYIVDRYGYWTWLNYIFSPDVLQTLKLLVFVFLIILIASLLYWPVTRFRFKYKILNYVFLSLILANITVSLFLLYSYFKILPGDILPAGNAYGQINWEVFFMIMISSSIFAVLFSLVLSILDHFVLTHSNTLFSRFLTRTAIFTVSVLVAVFSILGLTGDFSATSISLLVFGGTCLVIFGVPRSIFFYFKEKNENIILEKDLQLSQLTASKAEAEVASLHARINPHFLYNSLNSIAGLAHIDANKTEKMALSLSDLFRHNLNRKNQPFCTIEEEIEACKAYMEIEQIRFGSKLEFSTEIDESVYEYLIPRNIIQPLLENAIKHGVSQLNTTGKIKLKIIDSGENIEISVYDNGPDFQEGGISGYGLQSIFDILNLTYKNKAELSRENTPEKRVRISISKNDLNKAAQ